MSRPEYTMWSHALQATSTGSTTPLNLAATAAIYVGYAITTPIALNRVSFLVTTLVTAGSVAGQVSFVRYPTYGSTTNSVAIGTLTIPNAATVGQVYYKDVYSSTSSLTLNAGEELAIWIARQAVDSGNATGAGYVGLTFEPSPDSVGDQKNMVLSA